MVWTATIDAMSDDKTAIKIGFVFTDGVDKVYLSDAGFSTDTEIKNYIKNQLHAYEDKEGITIKVGDVFSIASLTTTPPPPTEEQVYQQLKQVVHNLKRDLDVGLATQAEFDAAVNAAIDAKPK